MPDTLQKALEGQMGKFATALLSKVAAKAISMLTDGFVEPDEVDGLIQFALGQLPGSDKPQDPNQEDVMLQNIQQQLDVLQEGQEEIKQLITSTQALGKVSDAKETVVYIRNQMRMANKNGDSQKFVSALNKIAGGEGGKGVGYELERAHDALIQHNNQLGKPFANAIQSWLYHRMANENSDFDFSFAKYEGELKHWEGLFSNVQKMGATLLILYEKSRESLPEGLNPDVVSRNIADIMKTHKLRLTAYKNTLFHISDSSAAILRKEAQLNPANAYPTLYVFRVDGSSTKCYGLEIDQPWPPTYLLAQVDVDGTRMNRRVFSLIPSGRGGWNLRGFESLGEVDPNFWTLGKTGNGALGTVEHGNFAEFKIIPENPDPSKGNIARVKLVQFDRQANRKEDTWICGLEETQLPLFVDPEMCKARVNTEVSRSNYSRTVFFTVSNHTPYIFILHGYWLQQSVAGAFIFENLVCLPEQDLYVGGRHDEDFDAVLQLRAYRLKDGSSPSQEYIRNLLYLRPSDGKPSLRPGGAEAILDLDIRLENPSGWAYNAVSAMEDTELPDPAHAWDRMDTMKRCEWRVTQNDTESRTLKDLKVEMTIGSGDKATGQMKIWKS